MNKSISDIKNDVPVSEVVGRYVKLKKTGGTLKGLCPFHSEKTPSFNVDDDKGFYHCFGCGAHGDVLDFLTKMENLTVKEGMNKLAGVPVVAKTTSTPAPTYIPVHPVPENKKLAIASHWMNSMGEIQGRWGYYNSKGHLLGYVVRFTDPSAKAIPFQWCGKDGWQSVGFTTPRPLYNLFRLTTDQRATVLIVEGEKTADAAQLLFPSLLVITWMGGANAVKQTDWTSIAGREVIIWRDNDEAGLKAEQDILSALNDCSIRIFKDNALSEFPIGYDAADCTLAGQQALDWLRGSITEYQRGGAGDAPSQDIAKSAHQRPLNPYFKCLGQVGNKYYFYNYSSGQVVNVGHDGFSEMFLLSLSNGDRNYWPGPKPDWKSIGGSLMAQCHAVGQFDLGMVRGRGTWEDAERIVTNTGNGLIVGKRKLSMNDFESDYVYLRSKKLDQNIIEPASHEQLKSLLTVIEGLRWEDKICAKLLAGWLMAAPICGALPWRSHIYIAGAAGSGKSWLYENIISRVLGKVSMRVSSKTTEAGIRHALGSDALPVIFDEAEAENIKDAERMQGIMDLARQASSPDGAPIMKGTANQEGAKIFYIRSSFCFLSIMPSIRQYADETRITILTLKNKDNLSLEQSKEKFKKLTIDAGLLLKGDFSSRFYSYADSVASIMRANFQTFADLGVIIFGNKRFADQIAMLLAGYHAYTSNQLISETDAVTLLEAYNWQSVIPSTESNNQARLLTRIAQHPIDVQARHKPSERYPRTIGELVSMLANLSHVSESFSHSDAEDALRRKGIIYDDDFKTVIIANQSEFLRTILGGTPWSVNWQQALKAIPGSVVIEKTTSFGGFKSRAMAIPVTSFLDTSEIT